MLAGARKEAFSLVVWDLFVDEHSEFVPSLLVLQMRYQIEMSRIPTAPVGAQMVYLSVAGDVAIEVGVRDDVGSYGMPIQRHTPVAPTTAITRGWTLPDEAWTGFVVENESKIFNG